MSVSHATGDIPKLRRIEEGKKTIAIFYREREYDSLGEGAWGPSTVDDEGLAPNADQEAAVHMARSMVKLGFNVEFYANIVRRDYGLDRHGVNWRPYYAIHGMLPPVWNETHILWPKLPTEKLPHAFIAVGNTGAAHLYNSTVVPHPKDPSLSTGAGHSANRLRNLAVIYDACVGRWVMTCAGAGLPGVPLACVPWPRLHLTAVYKSSAFQQVYDAKNLTKPASYLWARGIVTNPTALTSNYTRPLHGIITQVSSTLHPGQTSPGKDRHARSNTAGQQPTFICAPASNGCPPGRCGRCVALTLTRLNA